MFRVRILDRYILGEIVTPFVLSMAALTLVLFLHKMFRLAELVVSKGATIWSAAKVLIFAMPSFLVLTIPMSFLVGTLTAFTRLGADSEVTAMKASRISLYNMIRPVMLFAVAACLITSFISVFLAPEANHALKVQLFNMVKAQATMGIEPGVFSSTFDGMVIFVDKMDSLDDLEGIFISDERSAKEPYAIVARKGKLIADASSLDIMLALQDGAIHALPREDGSYSSMFFDSGRLYPDVINTVLLKGPPGREHEEIGSLELYREMKRTRTAGQDSRPIENELHKRLSLPFACLLFGIIGAPLGIRRTRSGKSAGIAIALLVFLLYYVLLATGTNLSSTGKLPPAVAYWMPNLFMVLGALALVVKKGQEYDLQIWKRLITWYYSLKARIRRKRNL